MYSRKRLFASTCHEDKVEWHGGYFPVLIGSALWELVDKHPKSSSLFDQALHEARYILKTKHTDKN
jgi:hypothetical protein